MKFINTSLPRSLRSTDTPELRTLPGYEAYGILFGRPCLSLKSTADAFVLQTYNNVLPFYHDIRTEEQWTLNSVMRQNCPNEARDLMNRDWEWGFNQFGTIRRCNLIIEKSQASTGLSDADKKHW